MAKLVFVCVFSLVVFSLPLFGAELPQVLQPNTTAYSTSDVSSLTQAIASLETTLDNSDLASMRYFSVSDWSSSDFAAYTAGILTGKGYSTEIVSGPGWSDGTHTWVLVGIPLGSKTAWTPVEASPLQGQEAQVLGHIPSTTDTAGSSWFETSYLEFTTLVQLPPNALPVASIRASAFVVEPGRSVKFLAAASYDPDGEIVLYKWDFGDGKTDSTTSWSVLHRFAKSGDHLVKLTIVDNRGAMAVATVTLVVRPDGPDPRPSGSGCGCGS